MSDVWQGIASAAASGLSALAAVGSAFVALKAVALQRRWGAADAFIRVSDRFESAEFRHHRVTIYRLDRADFVAWTDEERRAVDAWCAHLDLCAALILADQIEKRAFLFLYGDVVFRTIYQIAPYCNAQGRTRGSQFLLPIRMLTAELVTLWRVEAKAGRYPLTIGFPALPGIRVNPDLFDSDPDLLTFRWTAK